MKRFGAVARGSWNAKALDKPLLLPGFAAAWPSVGKRTDPRSWQNYSALKRRLQAVHGDDDAAIVVPVEFGGSYMDADMQQQHVGFFSVLDVLEQERKQEAKAKKQQQQHMRWFLAQHEVREVSPLLLDDVHVPHMLLMAAQGHTAGAGAGAGAAPSSTSASLSIYRNNLWLGGHAGTCSPCHWDPFHNILVQVYGQKRVVLFDPALAVNSPEALYAAEGARQRNTSLVTDICREDGGGGKEGFPLYAAAQGVQVTLQPGDALFIPHKWWHYCATEGASCSVNWWFL